MNRALVAVVLAGVVGLVFACGQKERGPTAPGVARAVSTSVCSPLTYGGEGRPRFLIPLVGPLQNAFSDHGIQNAQAAKLVLAQRGWRAGDHGVALQVCDESSADAYVDLGKCERLARAFAANPSVVAVAGPTISTCAGTMIPLLNDAPGGPLALLGMGNTYLGLTRAGPGVVEGDPERLYPTRRRSYFRANPADDVQAAASVLVARRAGARRPFALWDEAPYGRGLAGAFIGAARRAGMTPAGSSRWDGRAGGYRRLAERIRRAAADSVFLGGLVTSNGPRLIRDLRAVLGDDVALMGADGFNQPTAIVEGAGAAADGFTITLAARPVRALPAAGRRWAAAFKRRWGAQPCCYAVNAGQVMQIILDAIAASGGGRAGVLRAIGRTAIAGGLLGDLRFDSFGDTTATGIAVYRIRDGRVRFEEMVDVPRALVTRR